MNTRSQPLMSMFSIFWSSSSGCSRPTPNSAAWIASARSSSSCAFSGGRPAEDLARWRAPRAPGRSAPGRTAARPRRSSASMPAAASMPPLLGEPVADVAAQPLDQRVVHCPSPPAGPGRARLVRGGGRSTQGFSRIGLMTCRRAAEDRGRTCCAGLRLNGPTGTRGPEARPAGGVRRARRDCGADPRWGAGRPAGAGPSRGPSDQQGAVQLAAPLAGQQIGALGVVGDAAEHGRRGIRLAEHLLHLAERGPELLVVGHHHHADAKPRRPRLAAAAAKAAARSRSLITSATCTPGHEDDRGGLGEQVILRAVGAEPAAVRDHVGLRQRGEQPCRSVPRAGSARRPARRWSRQPARRARRAASACAPRPAAAACRGGPRRPG